MERADSEAAKSRIVETDSKAAERAFQAHLAEYEALQDETAGLMGLQHQLVNYGIAITGGAITLFAFGQPSVASQYPFTLLAVSLVISAINWAFLETYLKIRRVDVYIRYRLTPKVQALIGSDLKSEYVVFGWYWKRLSPKWILQNVVAVGKSAVTFIPSILFIVLYCYLRPPNNTIWLFHEIVFFWVAVGAVVGVPFIGLLTLASEVREEVRSKRDQSLGERWI